MARPRKEGMDYFPHDTDAVNDTKIEALRMLYGNDGYAFYFILLELIYRQPNFELDVSDAETLQILAKKVEVSPEKFSNMMQTAIKRECFDPVSYHERGVLTSEGVKKRSKVVVDKREKMRKKSSNGAENELLPDSCIVSDAETGEESTQSKSKSKSKRKVKEKINKIHYAEFVTLSREEYDKLISSHGEDKTNRMIEILNNYKGSNGKKYKSDYLAILNWVVKRVEEEEQRRGGSSGVSKYQGAAQSGYGGSDRKITSLDQTSRVREYSDEELAELI